MSVLEKGCKAEMKKGLLDTCLWSVDLEKFLQKQDIKQ